MVVSADLVIRMYFDVLGSHAHIRVFSGFKRQTSLGYAGKLCLRAEEWEILRQILKQSPQFELVEEASLVGSQHEQRDINGIRYYHRGPEKKRAEL